MRGLRRSLIFRNKEKILWFFFLSSLFIIKKGKKNIIDKDTNLFSYFPSEKLFKKPGRMVAFIVRNKHVNRE